MKKLFTVLSFVFALSFSANAGIGFSNNLLNSRLQISSTTELKTVNEDKQSEIKKNGKPFTWMCIDVQLSCTCGSMCGDFETAIQVAYWIAYWEGLLCGSQE